MLELRKILLKDVMVKNPYTIDINESFSKVWELLTEHGIRHLPVVENNRMRGLISSRDLYRIVSPRRTEDGTCFYGKEVLDRYILKQVMTKDVFTLSPSDTISKAIDVMVNRKYGCVPLVDEHGHLAGIVTPIDILKKLAVYFI